MISPIAMFIFYKMHYTVCAHHKLCYSAMVIFNQCNYAECLLLNIKKIAPTELICHQHRLLQMLNEASVFVAILGELGEKA